MVQGLRSSTASPCCSSAGCSAFMPSTVEVDGRSSRHRRASAYRASRRSGDRVVGARGHALLCDDVTLVEFRDSTAWTTPYWRNVHLLEDSATALGLEFDALPPFEHGPQGAFQAEHPLAESQVIDRVVVLAVADVDEPSRTARLAGAHRALLEHTDHDGVARIILGQERCCAGGPPRGHRPRHPHRACRRTVDPREHARRDRGRPVIGDATLLLAESWRLSPRRLVLQVVLLLSTAVLGGASLLLLIPIVNSVADGRVTVAIRNRLMLLGSVTYCSPKPQNPVIILIIKYTASMIALTTFLLFSFASGVDLCASSDFPFVFGATDADTTVTCLSRPEQEHEPSSGGRINKLSDLLYDRCALPICDLR